MLALPGCAVPGHGARQPPGGAGLSGLLLARRKCIFLLFQFLWNGFGQLVF